MKPIKISYIIITWNGLHFLRELLTSMQHQLERKDVEVVLVDNHSTDGTLDYLHDHYPALQPICLPENKGVAYARNIALKQAKGQYLFIVDNDIRLTDEAVSGMEQYMDIHPEVGICGCKLVSPTGEVQESCKMYPSLRVKLRSLVNRPMPSTYYRQLIQGTQPFEPVYLIGACQMIRREVYESIGPLDENIFYGPEDCDYCLRTRKAGWKIIYLPTITMIHRWQRTTHTKPFSRLGLLHLKALLYFYWKYKKV